MPPLNGLHENLAPRNDLLQHLALACRQFRLDIRDGRDCVLGGREGCVCELSVSVGTTGGRGTEMRTLASVSLDGVSLEGECKLTSTAEMRERTAVKPISIAGPFTDNHEAKQYVLHVGWSCRHILHIDTPCDSHHSSSASP